MWQETMDMAKKHDHSGSLWLKLQGDGDTAVVVFLGDPFPREVCFVDNKYVACDEAMKAQGHKPSLRVALNVAVLDTREVKVLEQGVMFFKDLVRVREKYGLDKWAFEIQRHGAAKDPKTSYSILPDRQLTPEEQQAFRELPLHDLTRLYVSESAGGAGAASRDARTVSGTIEPQVAQAIVTELKALPRQAVDRFLERFKVLRIKDLPASEVERARAFVGELAAELRPRAAAAEVDPFAE